MEGRFLTRPVPGSGLSFELVSGGPGGCEGTVRAVAYAERGLPRAGQLIRVTASWEGRAFPEPAWADRSGILRIRSDWDLSPNLDVRGWLLSIRGRIQHRILDLWGEDLAPADEALVLARREHLDPGLRDAFALSRTAHLLAISGFHVGVVAALLIGALRLAGFRRLGAEVGAVLGCWFYVLSIGTPYAAIRAGVLLSLLLGARLRGRPVMGAGAVGAALLVLLVAEPGWLSSVGFQLSFAGTAGLVLLRGSVAKTLDSLSRLMIGQGLPMRRADHLGARMLRGGADGVTAGIAATLATLPFLAWHFDRISLVGIPATLVVVPIAAIVIPGIGSSLLFSLLPGGFGSFLAGGTGLLLHLIERLVMWVSTVPGASIWVSRDVLFGALLTSGLFFCLLRALYPGRVRPSIRTLATTLGGLVAVAALPLIPLRRTLELHLIDVGQGDAVALRSPSGRWLLVDAGPRSERFDAGARRVVSYLRRHDATRLEALVLTHPHLDHIGGAPAVLRELGARGILDPSWPMGSRDYLGVLEAARDSGVSWWTARSGSTFRIDDVQLTVMHPNAALASAPSIADPNDLSVILLVQWGEATVLLTGDAPASVEGNLLDALPRLTVLKVGHHGSLTSTSSELLNRVTPRIALVPVGDGNRFGHPHSVVMDRLDRAGIRVYRTDRGGDVRVTIRPDGSVEARASRQ